MSAMGWLSLVSGGLGAAGAIVALWALWSRETYKSAAAALAVILKETKATLDLSVGAVAAHDATIKFLKDQINGFESDLDKCTEPGTIRERARLLLANAKTGNG